MCGNKEGRSLEFESLPQFGSVSRVDLKDAAERVGVAAVCKFCGAEDEDAKYKLDVPKKA